MDLDCYFLIQLSKQNNLRFRLNALDMYASYLVIQKVFDCLFDKIYANSNLRKRKSYPLMSDSEYIVLLLDYACGDASEELVMMIDCILDFMSDNENMLH